MRKVVLAMMTTLNGRLDDPDAWMSGLSDDHYQEIHRGYATFDTILMGRGTVAEMIDYWPAARNEEGASETHLGMAEKMHAYKKFVITSDPDLAFDWHNAEPVVISDDDQLRAFVQDLKARAGGDIHLSGGARLAQTFVRLGLVDEYRFFVYPVHSPGDAWFAALEKQHTLTLISSQAFEDGSVALYYKPSRCRESSAS